jgi:hypothetical protein
MFRYVVETDRRLYLANSVELDVRPVEGETVPPEFDPGAMPSG